MPKGLFITGTDTDAGKTVVSAAIIAEALEFGNKAIYMKPVQTGCVGKSDGKLTLPDVDAVVNFSRLNIPTEQEDYICPYKFEKPCSPHLAASLEHVEISIDTILQSYKKLSDNYEFVLAEGAGGIMVPINTSETTIDIIKIINTNIVIVSPNRLGTINHTLLTIQKARAENINICGIIFTNTLEVSDNEINKDNINMICEVGGVRCIGEIPYCKNQNDLITNSRATVRKFVKEYLSDL